MNIVFWCTAAAPSGQDLFCQKKYLAKKKIVGQKNKNKNKNKKAIQHWLFPRSPLPKYWTSPTMLNFAVRMGCGAFTVVWPYDEGCAARWYTRLKYVRN